jgi:phage recombination protein Bet
MSNLVIRPDQQGFTPQQLATLKQLGVEKVSEGDLGVFFHQCQRTGLDPFAKQIYMVGRWDGRANAMRYTIQTGIDGYRLIAERTGVYAGSDESWVEKDGKPVSATVTVRKVVAGQVCDFTATARWEEYVQLGKDSKPMGLWSKMPHRMLAKCAEALALRKAFPQDLSGLYTTDEMAQADSQSEPQRVEATRVDVPQPDADPLVSAENIDRFKAVCKQNGLDWVKVAANASVDMGNLRESQMPALRDSFKDLKSFDSGIVDAEIVEMPVEEQPPTPQELAEIVSDMFGGAEVFDAPPQSSPAKTIKDPSAPATPKQIGLIRTLLSKQSITERDAQLTAVGAVLFRTVGTFDELSKGDASTVIDGLSEK